jgi:hypothetical protein
MFGLSNDAMNRSKLKRSVLRMLKMIEGITRKRWVRSSSHILRGRSSVLLAFVDPDSSPNPL